MKNAGVGVGIPDTGRVKLVFEKDKKLHIYSGASCIGQGLGTVLTQMVVTNTDLKHEDIVYERSNTWFAPDSGTTSGSRQTLVTGEACRRACDKVMEDRNAGKTIDDVIGKIYYGEYLAKTDPLGANVPNPVSHVAYGYATQMCILDKKTGKIEEMVAAHDVGKAVNPLSCEGQIEGGVVMSIGFALREHYPIDENVAKTKELVKIVAEHNMSLEAEVGSIGGEEDGVVGMGECADPEECKRVADLGINFLAAGIGNIHGKYPANWQGLSFETLDAIQKLTGDMPLVLHGGTGIPADMIKKAISLGVSKINVNTECQLAFAEATRKYIEEGKDQQGKGYDPRKLLAPGAEAIKATVKEKMELFGSVNKA